VRVIVKVYIFSWLCSVRGDISSPINLFRVGALH